MTKISQYSSMTTLADEDLFDVTDQLTAAPTWGSRALSYLNLKSNLNNDLDFGAIGAANQIPYTNGTASAFAYTNDFVFDGSLMSINANVMIDNAKELRLQSDTANYNALKSPTGMGSNLTYTLPGAYPTSTGQVLASTTTGTMSWTDNTEPIVVYATTLTELTDAFAAFNAASKGGIVKLGADIDLVANLTLDFGTGIEIWGGGNNINLGGSSTYKIIVNGTRGLIRNVTFSGYANFNGSPAAKLNSQVFLEFDDSNLENFRIYESEFFNVVGSTATTAYNINIVSLNTESYLELAGCRIGTAHNGGATKPYAPFRISYSQSGASGIRFMLRDWVNSAPEAVTESTRWQTAKDSMVVKIDLTGGGALPTNKRAFFYDESITLDTTSMGLDLYPTFWGPTTRVLSGTNPTSSATFGNVGDIIVGGVALESIYMRHTDIGTSTANWSKIN
jgi:hypothetical protein